MSPDWTPAAHMVALFSSPTPHPGWLPARRLLALFLALWLKAAIAFHAFLPSPEGWFFPLGVHFTHTLLFG